jgi:phosphate/sulfate permease
MDFQTWVNLTLQAITIALALSGVIGYLAIRNKAKKQASKIATEISTKIAKETADKVTNEYIQKNLFEILGCYKSFSLGENDYFNAKKLEENKNEIK